MRRAFRGLLSVGALSGAVAVLAMPPALAAAISQSNGCFSPITSSWSTFAVPIVGVPSVSSVAAGGSFTLTQTKVTVIVDSAIIQAGYSAGVVSAGANTVASTVKLTLVGSNTSQGTQTVTGTANVGFTVTDDGSGTITVTPNPVTATVDLADSTWTATGAGTVVIGEAATQPASLTAPTLPERNTAPLQILNRVNNAINANFYCYPGAGGTGALAPGAAATVASVSVTGVSTTDPTTTGPTTTTTATTTSTVATTTVPATTVPATTTTVPGPTSGTYAASCKNSVTPDVSTLNFVVTAKAPASAAVGDSVALKSQSWVIKVPGSVLDAGIGLGLINEGDTLKGALDAAIAVKGATPASLTSNGVAVSIGPVKLGATTGTAEDVTTSASLPDSSVRATGGTVTFAMAVSKVTVTIGPLKVVFTCTPNTSTAFASTKVAGSMPVTGMRAEDIAAFVLAALAVLQLGFVLRGANRRRPA